MTGPLGAGYQDWGRSFATSRFLQIPAFGAVINAATVYGPFTTVNIDSLGVRVIATAGHGTITLDWYADSALTVFITTDRISLRQGVQCDQSVVVKGSFLKVTATNVAPAAWTFTLVLYETTRSVVPEQTPVANILISVVNVVVAAGGNSLQVASRVWADEAEWYVFCPGANWDATLEAIDENGATTRLDQIDQTLNLARRHQYLPACTVRVNFTNNAGAATAYNTVLVARPGLSGM